MIYQIWREDDCRENSAEVEAHWVEQAVEIWARHDDTASADYIIVNGNPAKVWVQAENETTAELYIVSGHAEPQYTARKL